MNLKSTSIKVILFLTLCLTFAFNAKAGYIVNGSASPTGTDCFILTPNQYGVGGSVWYENFMFLNYDFDMTFQVNLGSDDGGADGIAFVMQPNSTAAGAIGGGLGYQGITPSLAVEYDTWQNDDPAYDHIAIQPNGNTSTNGAALAGPVWASSTSDNIEDGQWHNTRIVWDAQTFTLSVYFDGILRVTYVGDIVTNIFGGNTKVYWGWTGATGAARNLQQFCVVSLFFEEDLSESIPLSPWAIGITIVLILGVTLLRYRRIL